MKIGHKTTSPTIERRAALARFTFGNGYIFSATDLGKNGVKIELSHRAGDSAAVILSVQKAQECGRWLLQGLGQPNRDVLKELLDVLKRLTKQKGLGVALQHGDKKIISDAIKMLKWKPQRN